MIQTMTSQPSSSNPGFAFVLNSLLNSNKNAKLLSKAKKESEVDFDASSRKPAQKLEIVNEEGAVVEEVEQSNDNNVSKKNNIVKTKSQQLETRVRRVDVESVGRVKPNMNEREYERKLSGIATKGVVQLFNVVKEQQKKISNKLTEAGTSGQKRAKALSEFTEDKFIERVNDKKMKTESSRSNNKKNKDNDESKKKKSFLSESFMAGDKFKNWDVESEEEEEIL